MHTVTQTFAVEAADGQFVRGTYRDTGAGPVGMFLHGLLSDAAGDKSMSLWHLAEAKNRSWVRFDMRAHGQSDGTFDEFTISRAMEDVKLIFGLFPSRPKLLVGSSMGGWVGAQLATEHSLQICGVVLIAPAFSFMEQLYQSVSPSEQQQWLDNGSWHFDSEGMDDGFSLTYKAVADARQYDLLNKPVEYGCPVRILHGRLDDVVPADQSVTFSNRLSAHSDIEVDILPQADHRLSGHVEYITEKVNDIWPVET